MNVQSEARHISYGLLVTWNISVQTANWNTEVELNNHTLFLYLIDWCVTKPQLALPKTPGPTRTPTDWEALPGDCSLLTNDHLIQVRCLFDCNYLPLLSLSMLMCNWSGGEQRFSPGPAQLCVLYNPCPSTPGQLQPWAFSLVIVLPDVVDSPDNLLAHHNYTGVTFRDLHQGFKSNDLVPVVNFRFIESSSCLVSLTSQSS